MEIELNVKDSIKAALDSVDIINKVNDSRSLIEEDIDLKSRNIEHLQIMLAKEWFAKELTIAESTFINEAIATN